MAGYCEWEDLLRKSNKLRASAYFPQWVVAQCTKHSIVGILQKNCAEKWAKKLNISPGWVAVDELGELLTRISFWNEQAIDGKTCTRQRCDSCANEQNRC